MKLISTLIFLIISNGLYSQQYHHLLDSVNEWTYVGNYLPVKIAGGGALCSYSQFITEQSRYYTNGDTIINSNSYHKLYFRALYNNECLYGFIREDTATRKIYFIDHQSAAEKLIYDFSMNVGDSIYLDFSIPFSNYYPTDHYRLDSISTINITAGQRNIFYLKPKNFNIQYNLVWIESVGSWTDLIYTHNQLQPSISAISFECPSEKMYFGQYLTCFSHADRVYFDSCAYSAALNNSCYTVLDSCTYFNHCSGIDENKLFINWKIYPNPSSDFINIEIEVAQPATVEIFVNDLFGRRVNIPGINEFIQKNATLTLPINKLSAGTYFIELNTDSGTVFKRFSIP